MKTRRVVVIVQPLRSQRELSRGVHRFGGGSTETALQFCGFLRDYLEWALHRETVPALLDQQTLVMARLHPQRVLSGRVAYFNEDDINNLIVTKDNIKHHAAIAREYRFMNLFASQSDWVPDAATGGVAPLVEADDRVPA